MPRQPDVIGLVDSRYPGLTAKVKRIIEESERKFTGDPRRTESYLWEHTILVASLSLELARAAKKDPLPPAVAALFHDAGKFAAGTYHGRGQPEEEAAAAIADRIARQAGMNARQIRRLTSGLRALYNDSLPRNWIADIVHDADFLSKFGALGVASFFMKSTLRGKTLQGALVSSLSKELTYAAGLADNMRTPAGRRRAKRKSRDSLAFYRSLLRELSESRLADFSIKRILIHPRSDLQKSVDVRLAITRSCGECGGRWKTAFRTEQGLKCEKLEAEIRCSVCDNTMTLSFCLPEIPGRAKYFRR